MKVTRFYIFFFLSVFFSCSGTKYFQQASTKAQDCNQFSSVLQPVFTHEYYAGQGIKYFQTMQSDVSVKVQPNYSDLVIRWEWPPWLLLTGFRKNGLIVTDIGLKLNPTAYDLLDCRYFDTQPFCRCHVVFNYGGTPCPIYEEFTFNNQGEITFIEAWSDYESLLPMKNGDDGKWDESEYWGMKEVNRISTKIPGLGNETGRIDPRSACFKDAAASDKDIADLLMRLGDANYQWIKQTLTHSKELESGCDIPMGDVYPYFR